MKVSALQSILLCAALAHTPAAIGETGEFSFGVISHPMKRSGTESALRDAIEESDADNLAFVVANGIKSSQEPCTDRIYSRRKALLDSAKNGLILSLAGSDWAECKNENGRSTAIGKLGRLRELFFVDEFSIGASKIPVTRQSTMTKFRSFAENARWELGNVMFATVNLPADNNHYVSDAGRNSEFEDRLVANRDWLNRVFTFAARGRSEGIIIFSDGNPLSEPRAAARARDGYVETRKQISALASKFPGKVLIVYSQSDKPSRTSVINWRGNLGELDAGSGWIKLTASPSQPELFIIESATTQASNNHR
jgi:hypothetical protein